MRGGYHIRISLTKPPPQDLASPSSSFTNQSSSVSRNAQYTPRSLFEPLPTHPSPPYGRRKAVHHSRSFSFHNSGSALKSEESLKDYRFGPLSIDWVDFEAQVKLSSEAPESPTTRRKMSIGKEKASSQGPLHSCN